MMLFSSSSVAFSSSTILQELLIEQNLLLHNSNPKFPATVFLGKLYKKNLICGEVVAKPHIFDQAPWHVHENGENVEYIGPKQQELAVLISDVHSYNPYIVSFQSYRVTNHGKKIIKNSRSE